MLQFGTPLPDAIDRSAAFGVAERGNQIALVRVDPGDGAPWWDLPGGALDPGEDEATALVREFGEETGLRIRVGQEVARVAQYFIKSDDQPVRNHGGVYDTIVEDEDAALKIEADHTPVWMEPRDAIAVLRHDSHAWAVAAWLRARR